MAYTDVTGIEPLLPFAMEREDRKKYFKFTREGDYPPHLDLDLNREWADNEEDDDNQKSTLAQTKIFDPTYLFQLGAMMVSIVPDRITGTGTPANGKRKSPTWKSITAIKSRQRRKERRMTRGKRAGLGSQLTISSTVPTWDS
jgi:hypothetical protein